MEIFNKSVDKNDLMLLNIEYYRATKLNDKTDTLEIIYKTISDGKIHKKSIDNVDIDIYFTKPEYRNYTYNKSFIELEKCEKHTCEYKKLPWYIANVAGKQYTDELRRLVECGKIAEINRINTYPYVFGSDIPIDVFYRVKWLNEYDNDNIKPISKLFLDIETDTIDIVGFPKNGSSPINAVTVVDDIGNSVYTFLLDTHNNPQITEFKNNIDEFISSLHQAFDESYGVLSYYIYMYDDEKDMIVDVFKLINTLKRDFCLIWNGFGFDIPYILDRMNVLNLDPYDIICHKDFKNKVIKFYEDKKNFKASNKGSYFKASTYTKFIDQMILYAATRKGQSELRSNALNAVGKKELNDEKLDYSDEANIKTLPYVNYVKFVMYNIKDTLLQKGIESKVGDVDNLYLRSYSNCTDYDKIFKQTVMLKNRAYYEYLLQNIILGNNINIYRVGTSKGKFSGALVGDPLLNSNTGISVFSNELSMFVYDDVIDMDFTAMYPNIIIAFNIERHTMVAKLIILDVDEENYQYKSLIEKSVNDELDDSDEFDDEFDDEEEIEDTSYDAGKDFIDNVLTSDVLSLGTKWFNLPDIYEITKIIESKSNNKPKKQINIDKLIDYVVDGLNIEIVG